MRDALTAQLAAYDRLYKELDDLYHGFARRCGLSDSALWLLYFLLEDEGGCTQAELCARWHYSKQTVNSTLKKLEAAGYVRLEPDAARKRGKRVALTGPGLALAQRTIAPLWAAERAAFGSLEAAERGEYLRLTEKHVAALRRETENALAEG